MSEIRLQFIRPQSYVRQEDPTWQTGSYRVCWRPGYKVSCPCHSSSDLISTCSSSVDLISKI